MGGDESPRPKQKKEVQIVSPQIAYMVVIGPVARKLSCTQSCTSV